jgi:cellulose biosynthesis protein BcsQ
VSTIGVMSANGAGATSVAAGLAGVLAARGRTLLIDLNPDLPEQAALLDVDDRTNVYHLAYDARLEPVSPAGLEDRVVWHEGLAVLPGTADPEHVSVIRDHFVKGLLEAASARYSWTIIDLGRARRELCPAATDAPLLWVLTPSPLGLAAFDRRFRQLRSAGAAWLERVRAVINQESDDSLAGVGEFLEREYGVPVAGTVPYEPTFWRGLELSHSLQPFCSELRDEGCFVSWFGRHALRTRRAIEGVVSRLEAAAMDAPHVGAEA